MKKKDEGDLRAEELASVWEAPDEAAATAVRDFLREQGIPATASAVQIAWMGGVETLHHGYWGKVEVLGRDAERARALVAGFLQGRPEPEAGPEDPSEEADE